MPGQFDAFFKEYENANGGAAVGARPSPFADTFDAARRQQQGLMATTARAGARADISAGVTVRRLADQTGLPLSIVGRNVPTLQERATAEDTQSVLRTNPALADWYSKDNAYDFVSGDELKRVNGFSWMLRSFGAAKREGDRNVELAQLRFRELTGEASPGDVARADALSAGRTSRDYGAKGWIQGAWVGLAGQAPMLWNALEVSTARGLEGASVGMGLAALAGQAGPQIGTPEEAVTVPGAAAVGFSVGSVTGQFESAFKLEAGLAYDEFKAIRDENGQPIDEGVARVAAIATGSANGLLELYGLRQTVGRIPGVDRLLGTITRQSVAQALRRPGVRAALGAFARDSLKAGAAEISTELMQEAVTMVAGELAKSASSGEFAAMTPGEAAGRFADVFEQTAKMMTLLGPLVGSSRLAGDIGRARRSVRVQNIFKAMGESAEASDLREQLPGQLRSLVAAATRDGPVDTVYVPAEKINELFQKEGIAATIFDGKIEGWRGRLSEAVATGGDVAIPLADFYTHIAGTDLGAQLSNDLKFRPEDMTANEAKAFNDAWDAARETLVQEAEVEATAGAEAAKAADPVFEDVREKAIAAGIAPDQATQYGTLYRAFFDTLAKRAGVTPEELYRAYGLEIRQAVDGPAEFRRVTATDLTIDALRSGEADKAIRSVQKKRGRPLLDYIIKRGGIVDTGGELTAMDAHKFRRTLRGRPGQLIRKPAVEAGEALPGMRADVARGVDSEWGLDATARDAWENGYFPEFTERPSTDDLLNAIREGLGGNDRYSTTVEEVATDRELSLIHANSMLDRLGIDRDATNEEIKNALNAAQNDVSEAGELFQSAWHGSPHIFDEFSLHKIGTGEGAQAYGWGLYFAGKRGIAEHYRNKLAGNSVKLGGKVLPMNTIGDMEVFAEEIGNAMQAAGINAALPPDVERVIFTRDLSDLVTEAFDEVNGDQGSIINDAVAYLYGKAGREEDRLRGTHIDVGTARRVAEAYEQAGRTLEKFAKDGGITVDRGRLYKVDIPEDDTYLLWDKPIADQPAAVKAALEKLGVGIIQPVDPPSDPVIARIVKEALRQTRDDDTGATDAYQIELMIDNDRKLYDLARGHANRAGIEEIESAGDYVGQLAESYINSLKRVQNLTGEKFYREFVPADGGPEAASRALAAAGINGIKYLAGTSRSSGEGDFNYVVFDDKLIKITEFEQADQRGTRGSIQLGQGRTVINLFQSADLSTFLHESGHFFLEVFRDVASKGGVSEELAADWETLKQYLGTDGSLSVDQHEKFARSFEAYLFEGKAPSEALAGIFSRFSAWLRMLYREVKRLGVRVPKEVFGVMDRMLASDREIDTLSRQSEIRPVFATAEDAGMTDKQFAAYRELADRAVEHAKRELTAKMLGEVKRETTRAWRETRATVKAEVTSELSRIPIFQAQHYLRTGEFLASGLRHEGVARLRMDKAAIVELFGKEALKRLPRGRPPIYADKGGVHPDFIAEMFGLKSGYELIEMLMSTPDYRRAVADEVARRMRARFGDLLTEQDRRSSEAMASIDNDQRGKLLEAEYKVIIKRGALDSTINRERARVAAGSMIAGKSIADATRVGVYAAAEQKAARHAEKAILSADWTGAAAWKQRQIFNHYLARESRRAAEDASKILRNIQRFTGKKGRDIEGINPAHVLQIEAMLDRFDFRRATRIRQVPEGLRDRPESLAAFVAAQEAEGNIVVLPEELLDERFRKSYKQFSVEELRALNDAVRALEHAGRRWGKVRDGQKLRAFTGVRDELVAGLRANLGERKLSNDQNPRKLERFKEATFGIDAALLKIEQIVEWIDGGDINGPARRHVWQPIADAEAAENALQTEYTAKISTIVDNRFKPGYLTEYINVAAVDRRFTRAEIFAVALNTGTESNLDKLMRGNGWSEQQLAAVLGHLTDEDWNAVVDIRAVVNSLWPKIAAVQKRLTGYEPEKVEPHDFTLPSGRVIPGGYYPVVYDPRRSRKVERNVEAQAGKLFDSSYIRPDTPHGFTKARTKAAFPMKLDLMVLPQHLSQVIHDATHREAIRDVYKLINDGAVQDEIERRLNRPIARMFTPWLKSIANDREPNDGMGPIDRFLEKNRTNVSFMAMGWKFTTQLAQLAGVFPSLERVSALHLLGAYKSLARHPAQVTQFVWSKSAEMKNRFNSLDRDIRHGLRSLDGKAGVFNPSGTWGGWGLGLATEIAHGRVTGLTNDAKKFAFHGIGYMDMLISLPTWLGAYNQHLKNFPMDEAGAVAEADRTVRLTQSAGAAKDLSAVQRKAGLYRYLTMFYSYFNAVYNRMRTLARDTRTAARERDWQALPGLLARSFFIIVAPAIVGELLAGRAPDSGDDGEGWARWAARKIATYPLLTIPGLRDAANVLDSGYGYTFTPAGRSVETVLKTIGDIKKIAAGDEVKPRLVAKHALQSAGYVMGWPIGQPITVMDNLWLAMEEDGDIGLRDFIYTRPPK